MKALGLVIPAPHLFAGVSVLFAALLVRTRKSSTATERAVSCRSKVLDIAGNIVSGVGRHVPFSFYDAATSLGRKILGNMEVVK